MSIKRVYMMTDLEGVAGVDDWDPRHRDDAATARGVYDRAEMQRLLTAEVNAAIEGLREAGVEQILINDAHGAGRTILPEQLPGGVQFVQGTGRRVWLPGLSDQFDALVQLGMHAMSNTPDGCLAHTMTREAQCYRLNGREVGEMQIAAYMAGELGVPWIFTSGDLHACREAEAWVTGMVTAPVKEGLGETLAVHLSPVDARERIRGRIGDAVAAGRSIAAMRLERPVVMEIEHRSPQTPPDNPQVRVLDARTFRYEGGSVWEVMGHHRGIPHPMPTALM